MLPHDTCLTTPSLLVFLFDLGGWVVPIMLGWVVFLVLYEAVDVRSPSLS